MHSPLMPPWKVDIDVLETLCQMASSPEEPA